MSTTTAGAAFVGVQDEAVAGVTGLSAVGYYYNSSGMACTADPLLELVDSPEGGSIPPRSRGWALTLMRHVAGVFAGGRWVLSGLSAPSSASPLLLRVLAAVIQGSGGGGRLQPVVTVTVVPASSEPLKPTRGPPTRFPSVLDLSQQAPRQGTVAGFVRLSPDRHHLVYPDGTLFFALGGDYFRGASGDDITPEQLRVDFTNAARAGYNLVRVYGFTPDVLIQPPFLAVYREMLALYGLRLLVVMACYKDPDQATEVGIVASTTSLARMLANETWLLGYDFCNEPDDSSLFPASVRVGDGSSNKTLGELYPNMMRWGEYEKWQCGGWSTTFGEACGNISSPVLPSIPAALVPAFADMNSAFGAWASWKVAAVRAAAPHHLVTIGNNALHSLLPANEETDFISHHVYPTNPQGNSTVYFVSPTNVTELATVITRLQGIWSKSPPRPILLGEFGTRTAKGLQELYLPALPVELPVARSPTGLAAPSKPLLPLPPAVSRPARPRYPYAGCTLSESCMAGVASTIDWYLAHGETACWHVWQLAVVANAGPNSTHRRCPATAGTRSDAWQNAVYKPCYAAIMAAGKANNESTCVPQTAPLLAVLDFQSAAVWDMLVWAQSLVAGASGGLMWALAEKPYVLASIADGWSGDDRQPGPHDAYVAGSRFGLFYYDGVSGGRAKPAALAARFLADYLRCRPTIPPGSTGGESTGNKGTGEHPFSLQTFPMNAGVLPISYALTGPELLLVGASTFRSPALNFTAPDGSAALVMVESNSCRCPAAGLAGQAYTRVMATLDGVVANIANSNPSSTAMRQSLKLVAGEPVCTLA